MRCENKNDKLDLALKCALHEDVKPDDALHRKILYNIKEVKDMKERKLKPAITLAAALAGLILVSGAGYAAVTGSELLAEFKRNKVQVSEEAQKLVDRKPEVKVTDKINELTYIDYTVDEIVCDDYTIYSRVTIKPKDADKYLLIDDTVTATSLDDSVTKLGIDGVTKGTIGEYANGKKLIRISCDMLLNSLDEGYSKGAPLNETSWSEYGKNGELYCYSAVQDVPESETYTEKICINEYEDWISSLNGVHNGETLTVTTDNKSSVNNKKEYKTVSDKLDYGIEVSKLSAITTELGTYITIKHTPVIEYAPNDYGSISPSLFDENGKEIDVLSGYGKANIMHLNFGVLDMDKVSIGFKRMYDINHDKIDESIIGPYKIEEIK